MKIQYAVTFAWLLSITVANVPLSAAEEGPVESRGLDLPRVTVPPPPPPPTMQILNVRVVGEGQGKVTLPPAAACPPACSASYPQNAPVMLAPIPAPGSTFAGWGGDCRGTAPCTLRMDRPHTVEAAFNKIQAATPTGPSAPPFPNVVKTPAPGGPIPIPYPNVGGAALAPELAAISTMLANGKPANTILDAWKGYVTRRVQSKQPLDVQRTIQDVRIQAEALANTRTEAERARLGKTRDAMNEMSQQDMLALQQFMNKQQQIYQMISNMSKKMHDTATAIIGNIRG